LWNQNKRIHSIKNYYGLFSILELLWTSLKEKITIVNLSYDNKKIKERLSVSPYSPDYFTARKARCNTLSMFKHPPVQQEVFFIAWKKEVILDAI
jgi:hypothetical protein